MTKEFGSTDSHTDGWGGGEVVMGGYSDVVMNDSHLSTTCTAAAGDNDIYFLEGGGWRGRLITSDISLMSHGVRPLTFALGSSSGSTKVDFTRQQL